MPESESYNLVWEGPELSVLRMLGLFDRPADENVLGTLLNDLLSRALQVANNLSSTEWRKILSRLRRARLLAIEDPPPRGPGHPSSGA
jgi:hypothetical protein